MGKYKKLGFLAFITTLYVFSCSNHNSKVEPVTLKDAAILDKEFLIPDTLGISSYMHSYRYFKDNIFYISEGYTHMIYKIDLNTKTVKPFGKLGNGPGEYNGAYDFNFYKNKIYFNERRGLRFQSFNFSDSTYKFYKKISTVGIVNSKILNYNDTFYFLLSGTTNHPYYLLDEHGNKFFPASDFFFKSNYNYPALNFVAYDDKIFLMHQFEDILFVLDTKTKKESKIQLKGVPNVYDFSNMYDQIVTNSDFFSNIVNENTVFRELAMAQVNNSYYFIVCTQTRDYKSTLYIFNTKYKLSKIITLEKLYFLTSRKNKLLFVTNNFETGEVTFKQYILDI